MIQPVIPSVRFQPSLEEKIAAAIQEVPALAPVSDEGSLEEDLRLSEDEEEQMGEEVQLDQDMTIDDD